MLLHERVASLRGMVPGLSNSELDRLCRLRKGHTRAIETNPEANPTVETIQKIAGTFGVPVGYLASGEGKAPFAVDVITAVGKAREEYAKEKPKEEAAAEPEAAFRDSYPPTGTDGDS